MQPSSVSHLFRFIHDPDLHLPHFWALLKVMHPSSSVAGSWGRCFWLYQSALVSSAPALYLQTATILLPGRLPLPCNLSMLLLPSWQMLRVIPRDQLPANLCPWFPIWTECAFSAQAMLRALLILCLHSFWLILCLIHDHPQHVCLSTFCLNLGFSERQLPLTSGFNYGDQTL